MDPELSIIIPAYNEAEHLEKVVTELTASLRGAGISHEICVVDNGSSDGTLALVEKLAAEDPNVTYVHLEKNQHYGGGVLEGLKGARGAVIGWADADGQVDPKDIVRLYSKMMEEGKELGKAVRIVRSDGHFRAIQTRIYNGIFSALFLTRYSDVNAKPKLLTRSAAETLALCSRDYFLDPEFVIKALRMRMSITEVETTWRERQSGSTRIHALAGLSFLRSMLAYRFGIR